MRGGEMRGCVMRGCEMRGWWYILVGGRVVAEEMKVGGEGQVGEAGPTSEPRIERARPISALVSEWNWRLCQDGYALHDEEMLSVIAEVTTPYSYTICMVSSAYENIGLLW